jgi:Tol biopolymer transport system component
MLVVLGALLLIRGEPVPAAGVARADPAVERVAFVRDGDVWAKDVPDGAEQQLTSDGINDSPRWSRSGTRLAFVKRAPDPDRPTLWTMSAAGADARPVAALGPGSGQRAAWAPNDDVLAYVSDGGLFLARPDGAAPLQLVAPGSGVQDLAWSPDGQRLAYTTVLSVSSGTPPDREATVRWLPAGGGDPVEVVNGGEPAMAGFIVAGWSPDGQQILYWMDPLFSASVLADGVPLRAVPAGGGSPKSLVGTILPLSEFLDWSPDGTTLALVAGGGREARDGKGIAVTTLPGELQTVTDSALSARYPAWSPDGAWIAFSAGPAAARPADGAPTPTPAAAPAIWLVRPDGSEAHALLPDTGQAPAERPRWSSDGQSIRFVRPPADGRPAQIVTAGADGTGEQVLVDGLGGGDTMTDALTSAGRYVDWGRLVDWWEP